MSVPAYQLVGRTDKTPGPKLGIRVETIPACSIVPSNTAGLKHSKAWMVGLLVLPVHFETRVAKCKIFYTEQIFQTKFYLKKST